jgi:hypothetical protein
MADDTSILGAYEAGSIGPGEALHSLWSDLREVESQAAVLEAERARLRDQISQIVAREGPMTLPGFGTAQITAPSRSVSYDAKQLTQLLADIERTHPEIAERLREAQRVSERSGGLRIVAERSGDARPR